MAPKRRGSSSTFMWSGTSPCALTSPLSDCRVLLILVEEDLCSPDITEISVSFAIVSMVLLSHEDDGRHHPVSPSN